MNDCAATCPLEFTQDPADKLDYTVKFDDELALRWEPETSYSLSDRRRPTASTGFEYECTTAGQSGRKEPVWPKVVGQTITDGSVTWTCRALSSSSLRTTLASATWNADAAITVSGQTVSGAKAIAYLEGGLAGTDYEIRVQGTMADGTKRSKLFVLKIDRARCVNG